MCIEPVTAPLFNASQFSVALPATISLHTPKSTCTMKLQSRRGWGWNISGRRFYTHPPKSVVPPCNMGGTSQSMTPLSLTWTYQYLSEQSPFRLLLLLLLLLPSQALARCWLCSLEVCQCCHHLLLLPPPLVPAATPQQLLACHPAPPHLHRHPATLLLLPGPRDDAAGCCSSPE